MFALAALGALAWWPAPGLANKVIENPAGPLSAIYITEDLGCQVLATGDTSPSFFGGNEPGGCGTFLALTEGEHVTENENPRLFGPSVGPSVEADYKPLGEQTLTGNGTSTEPYVVTTLTTAEEPLPEGGSAPVADIGESDIYVSGQERYETTITIVNVGKTKLAGTLYHAGDCFLLNQDEGYGAANVGGADSPACTIDPENSPSAGFMAFTLLTTNGPATHFFESNFSTVWSRVTREGTQFPDTVDGVTRQDNGMGLSWPISLEPEQGAGVSFMTTVSRTGAPPPPPPNPCPAGSQPSVTIASDQGRTSYARGETATVTIAAAGPGLTSNPSATKVPISTATPGSFSVTRSATNACGTANATFAYTVTAATLESLPPPVLGTSVNVAPVSGEVLVKLPPGYVPPASTSARYARPGFASLAGPLPFATESLSKGVGFIPLAEARQIPVGSILDTTAGVARLATATATQGKLQSGDFETGIFKLLQRRKQRGLTELDIIDNHSARQVCASAGKARTAGAHASGKILGRLSADSHGHFTARGQFSAATVRGTIWGVRNLCSGTLTRVTRGVVTVRDFRRRKTITLFTGQSYLAKAPHY
jgi:hypothetical protein